MEEELFKEQANYLILGKKGSAKSSLGFSTLKTIQETQNKKAYVFRFPKPKILKKLPFKVKNLSNFDSLFQLTDAVVLVDEAHIHFPVMEKKVNEDLRNLLSLSRQNNVDFIFVCHNSYFINRGLFSFIDIKMIKEVNPQHWELERSYMKKLYQSVHVFGKENFFLDSDLVRGPQFFDKPDWYTDEISSAYKNKKQEKTDFFSLFKKRADN